MSKSQMSVDLQNHLHDRLDRTLGDYTDTARIGGLSRDDIRHTIMITMFSIAADVAIHTGLPKAYFMGLADGIFNIKQKQEGK